MTDWRHLFAESGDTPTETVHLQTLRRSGRDWLVLPASGRLAQRALALYSPQKTAARLAKRALGALLRVRSPLKRETIQIGSDGAFARFLREVAGTGNKLPAFGLLSGNPNVAGRRFVILVFGNEAEPVAVVKAGAGDEARALIRSEERFLRANPNIAGAPSLIGGFEGETVSAFATAYVDGKSPGVDPPASLLRLLEQWIDQANRIVIAQLAPWPELSASPAHPRVLEHLNRRIANVHVHPVVWHGDFAPWNIKRTATGQWTVLDWEASEPQGLPGWNWIHYVVSAGCLVGGLSADQMDRRLRRLLGSAEFRSYAEKTRIAGIEEEVLLAYLLYSAGRTLEHASTISSLLNLVADRIVAGSAARG